MLLTAVRLICSILYGKELQAALEANPKHMRLDIALSLEQQNAQGGPEYVQVCTAGCTSCGLRPGSVRGLHGTLVNVLDADARMDSRYNLASNSRLYLHGCAFKVFHTHVLNKPRHLTARVSPSA